MAAPGEREPAQLGELLEALRLPDPEPRRQRSRWRIAALLAALALAVAIGVWLLPAAALEVQVAAAEPFAEAARQPIPVLSGTGYLIPAQPVIAVGSRVAGRIARYDVDEGDRVE
ncbi:MAG TPA: hypothetical protein VEI82_10230, partial [Myxococcota bacterium]|nr:hypothetical protein [Myxococcota bacterium]